MRELKYDEELPFAVLEGGYVIARFPYKNMAQEFVRKMGHGYNVIVDTTSKPKIPEDAEFIFVEDGDQSVFARREGVVDGQKIWLIPGDFVTEAELIEDFIGDSEVTVLVRKESE